MLRMGKKPLSLLCACILVFSLVPAVALAVTVTFSVSGSDDAAPAAQSVGVGEKVTEPSLSTVSRAYYVFKGWYKDSGLTQKWNFSTDTIATDTDLTLYAAWIHTPGSLSSNGSTTGGYSYNNYSPSACYSAYNPSAYYPSDYYYYPTTCYAASEYINIPKTGDAVHAFPYLCLALSALCAAAYIFRCSKSAS